MLCCPFDLSIKLYNHHHRLSQNLPNFLSLSSYQKTRNPKGLQVFCCSRGDRI
jgi:hypothetical protein